MPTHLARVDTIENASWLMILRKSVCSLCQHLCRGSRSVAITATPGAHSMIRRVGRLPARQCNSRLTGKEVHTPPEQFILPTLNEAYPAERPAGPK
jgi:hypothetical protein